ncbi:LytR/AlgR family response regulator transcription factor [Mucilaginibacter gotjawali]|uniref:Transcriptional regulatory protein YehT n=2 Tax=Mucilaginibacter gotjawali TaxID=1550579 RepID=A0A110B1D4_9SPHI|nr:LytTR family DNA-binding domain-containing protein [Mucilaginibacter gotjawali]MBB3056627.1 two-component system LytT family response regulator [Mucilaginibacter gotjawali]BAU52670.1 Transcriptional regulatory protein YehT [Mucilaginibacter gotjawali]
MKAIIVDDEPKGRNILLQLLTQHFPQIKVVATAADADEGIRRIDAWKPDVVFLDVEMPGKNGFDMLKELGNIDFKIIFVSAHNHYALNAIKLSAIDFLLKPIDLDDLGKAIQRLNSLPVHSVQQVPHLLQQLQQSKNRFDKIAIASATAIEFVNINDIVYCKADNAYTEVYLNNTVITSTKNLKDFDDLLSPHFFFRVHHSYLINMNHIKKYIKGEGGSVIMRNDVEIEVSRRRKSAFLELLSSI